MFSVEGEGERFTLEQIYNCDETGLYYRFIFLDWFHKEFVPSVKMHMTEKGLPIKALLLLDNAPAHPA